MGRSRKYRVPHPGRKGNAYERQWRDDDEERAEPGERGKADRVSDRKNGTENLRQRQ